MPDMSVMRSKKSVILTHDECKLNAAFWIPQDVLNVFLGCFQQKTRFPCDKREHEFSLDSESSQRLLPVSLDVKPQPK